MKDGFGHVGPRHQIVDFALWMSGDDSRDDVGEIGHGLDAVELGSLDDGSDHGPVLRAAVGACEERVLAIEGDRADGALDHVGVQLDASVVEEPGQADPSRQGVADGFGQLALLADEGELFPEPGFECRDEGSASRLALGLSFFGIAAVYLALDPVERGDPGKRLGSDRRGAGLGQFVEAPADMAPAEGQADGIAFGQHLVAGVAVDLQDAGEALQVPDRMSSGARRD